jgi:hypothetical protein
MGILLDFFPFECIVQYCFICRPIDSTVSEMMVLNPNLCCDFAISSQTLQLSWLDLIHPLDLVHRLDLIHKRLDLIHNRLDLIHKRLDLIHNRLDLINKRRDRIHKRLHLINKRLEFIYKRLDINGYISTD